MNWAGVKGCLCENPLIVSFGDADLIIKVFAFVRSRGEDEVHDDIERVLGRPAISFRQFAHDNADELAKQVV